MDKEKKAIALRPVKHQCVGSKASGHLVSGEEASPDVYWGYTGQIVASEPGIYSKLQDRAAKGKMGVLTGCFFNILIEYLKIQMNMDSQKHYSFKYNDLKNRVVK
jgi:hypothetical protein